MKTSEIKIGQRVAKGDGRMGLKVGSVKEVNFDKVLVDFDNHANRWVSAINLELVK